MNHEPDTRQRIIASARDLIYGRSYGNVGVAEICERADIRKGSFYHFFPSKQALSLAVIDELRAVLEEQVFAPAFARDIPPLKRFERFALKIYEFQKETSASTGRLLGCPFGNLALEMATSDNVIRRKLEAIFQGIEARFAEALEEAAANGELEGDVDIPATTRAMLAYIEGVLMIAKTGNDAETIRRLGPALADVRIRVAGST